jgi:acetoin utilization protein AcuB
MYMLRSLNIPVAEIMTRDLLIVEPGDTLEKVRDIFQSNRLHHVPVVDRQGKLVGLISKSDFNRVNHILTLLDGQKYRTYNDVLYRSLTAEEIMTKQLTTLGPEDTLAVAADFFRENLFQALPVVDKNFLIGIVTTHDLINYCCSETQALT